MNRLLTTQGWLVLLLTLAILGFLVYLFLGFGKEKFVAEPIVEETPVVETTPTKVCYARTQVATETEPYEVSEKITLSIEGDVVTGTKSGTQKGPDMTNGYEGTLRGTKSGDDLELTYSYTIEGSENKELELYTMSDTGLQKHRYVLIEENDILVPDKTSEVKQIEYPNAICL